MATPAEYRRAAMELFFEVLDDPEGHHRAELGVPMPVGITTAAQAVIHDEVRKAFKGALTIAGCLLLYLEKYSSEERSTREWLQCAALDSELYYPPDALQ